MITSCFPPPGHTPTFSFMFHGSALFFICMAIIGLSMTGCAGAHVIETKTPQGTVLAKRVHVLGVNVSSTTVKSDAAYDQCVAQFGQPSRGNPGWQWMLDEQAKQWAWRCREDAKGLSANPAGSRLGYTNNSAGYGPGMMPGMMGGQFLLGAQQFGYYSNSYGSLAIDGAGQPWNAQGIVNEDLARQVAKAQGYGYGHPLQVAKAPTIVHSKDDDEFKAAMAKQLREQQAAIEALKATKAKAGDDEDDDKDSKKK